MKNIDKAERKTAPKYSAEVRERAVRMVFEHRSEYATQWEAIQSIVREDGLFARDPQKLSSPG